MTRLDDCTPTPEEQARYANSDDEERLVPKMVPSAEERALAAMKKERDFFAKTKEKTGGIPSVRGWPADEIDRAFRDGALAERDAAARMNEALARVTDERDAALRLLDEGRAKIAEAAEKIVACEHLFNGTAESRHRLRAAIRALADAPPQPERPRRQLPFPHRFEGGSFGGGDQGECARCGLDARDHDDPNPSRSEPTPTT